MSKSNCRWKRFDFWLFLGRMLHQVRGQGGTLKHSTHTHTNTFLEHLLHQVWIEFILKHKVDWEHSLLKYKQRGQNGEQFDKCFFFRLRVTFFLSGREQQVGRGVVHLNLCYSPGIANIFCTFFDFIFCIFFALTSQILYLARCSPFWSLSGCVWWWTS